MDSSRSQSRRALKVATCRACDGVAGRMLTGFPHPPRLGTRETDNGNSKNEACNIECCTQGEPSRNRMGFGTDEVSNGDLLQLAHMKCECNVHGRNQQHILGLASARLRCNVHRRLVQCDSQKPLEQERGTREVHPRARHSQRRETVE